MGNIIGNLFHFTTDYQPKEEIILRDYLALERTKLANERTLLSYVRTTLYLILAGIAFLGMEDLANISIMGYFSISLSLIILAIGLIRYYQLKRQIMKMYRTSDREYPVKDSPVLSKNIDIQ